MGIVTLLSDFGVRNGYVAAMKGVIGGHGNLELAVDRGSAAARLESSVGSRAELAKR